jgi:hypothetical protein
LCKHKKTQAEKKSIQQETNAQSAQQKADQENLCVRGDEDCEQANEGQQVIGRDNVAKGFNDQSANVQSLGAQPTETPPETPPVTPPIGACSGCFATAFASAPTPLTPLQITLLIAELGGADIISLCGLTTFNAATLHAVLDLNLGAANVDILIQCLINAGVTVTGL